MEFLKTSQLELNPANYLISKETKKPVNHPKFVAEQKAAEFTVKLAEAIKNKTFTTTTPDNIEQIINEVKASMNNSQETYVSTPKAPTSEVNDELLKYALDFDKHQDNVYITKVINDNMQQFNSINDVEKVGDYFTEGVVKLSKIYTIAEILAAIKINVEKLG